MIGMEITPLKVTPGEMFEPLFIDLVVQEKRKMNFHFGQVDRNRDGRNRFENLDVKYIALNFFHNDLD